MKYNRYLAKTRKPHNCEWCGNPIEISSEAWFRFYEVDLKKRSAYIHPDCYEASSRISSSWARR